MRSLLREYLRPGRGERSGLLVFAFLIFTLLLYRFWLADLIFAPTGPELRAMQDALIRFEKELEEKERPPQKTFSAEPFNPNTADERTLVSSGIPSFLAARIIRFREKGGTFRKKADLKKIYGLSDSLYSFLEDRIRIPQAPAREKHALPEKIREMRPREARYSMVALNTGDSADWEQLPGIGPYTANRIIRYRDRLGGFVSREQLKEVYGLKPETCALIAPYLSEQPEAVRKLNLNTGDYQLFAGHPYIDKKLASLILRYREQHGPYRSAEDLKKLKLVNDSIFERIRPYLSAD